MHGPTQVKTWRKKWRHTHAPLEIPPLHCERGRDNHRQGLQPQNPRRSMEFMQGVELPSGKTLEEFVTSVLMPKKNPSTENFSGFSNGVPTMRSSLDETLASHTYVSSTGPSEREARFTRRQQKFTDPAFFRYIAMDVLVSVPGRLRMLNSLQHKSWKCRKRTQVITTRGRDHPNCSENS